MMRGAVLVAAVLMSGGAPAVTLAQPAPEPRLAVSVGPAWIGGADVSGRDASLTSNPNGTFPLFETDSTLTGGVGIGAAVGVRLRAGVWAEAAAQYHSARLSTRIGGDREAADETATEGVQQVQILAGALWLPDAWRLGDHLRFYAAGGGGYLRQLHASNTLAETGRAYYAGGGAVVSLPQRRGGTFKASGLRVDVRAAMTDGGVSFDDAISIAPAVWVGLFLRF